MVGFGGSILHINPRFKDGQIVRNSEDGNGWGAEERNGDFVFEHNEAFELVIKVDEDAYRV